MPILPVADYQPSFPFTFGHIQTLYPTLFRKVPAAEPSRERLELDDGDFLDIDWHYAAQGSSDRLAVISHGLEGNSRKKYMLGMARIMTQKGWDVICLNFRGCSGEINRLPRLYHSGVTDDLHRVVCHGLEQGRYDTAALIGFSMGGNQTLKYLGENPEKVPRQVQKAVAVSVPVMLADSVSVMDRLVNRIYMEYFMHGLHQKVMIKANMFPEVYCTRRLARKRTFFPFDDAYTAPVHGFDGAADYYSKCSSRQFLPAISVDTLLIQALDDPFLPESCYPYEEAKKHQHLFLETTKYGGHVGFVSDNGSATYWIEERAAQFLS